MGSRPKNDVVRDAFTNCQDSFAVHPKLIKRLKTYYEKNDPDRFFESFMYYLKYPISGYVERSVFVDRTLEFVAKFACAFLEKEKKEGENGEADAGDHVEETEEELPLFLYRLFAWLLDHHEVEGADARLRVCQLLNKLLKYMGEEACIDDDLYNKIYDGMLERLKDRVAEIRSQAVTALQRLQDPKDEECPIIKAYLFHLAHDPNNVVRRTIVRCIGATRLTLPHILERTRDTDEHVRRAAYKFLAEKVHIKSLTIGQREGLLQRGLGERSEPVRRVVERELLPAWLRLSGENIVQLLHHLDVGNSDQEVAARAGARPSAPAGALNVLFNETAPRELVEQFQYLDTDKLVPFEKLTPETAMYWRVLTKYLRDEGAEDCLELLLPELTPFCQYVRHYVLEMEKEDEDLNWEFVARELVAITGVFDLADEVGRQHLVSLVKALLTSSRTPASFIPALVEVFTRVEKDPQSRVNQVAEVISELKDPMQSSTQKGQASISAGSDTFFDAAETLTPSPKKNAAAVQLERDMLAKQMGIAKLRVAMNEAKEELGKAVAGQDFIRAQEVKATLDGLEEQVVVAEEELRVLKGTSAAAAAANEKQPEATSVPESDDEEVQGGEVDPDNPTVTLKCLKLLTATLQDPKITSLNATLHTLMETFVTVSVQSEISGIRREAIVALCCLCLRSLDSARQHMLLLLQAAHIDVHEVRIAAISAVVDLLMRHGLASFITTSNSAGDDLDNSGTGSEAASRCADTADSHSNIESVLDSDMTTKGATLTQNELNAQGGNSVVAILTKILDEPDLELRTETAEGLCKLLMIGAISSPKLLSRLLLIWYNPMTEPSCKLRHILGTFFPLYCSMSQPNQVAMESAFIPTMRVLFDAPITSPLNEIDVEDVGMFFVHLTREDMLQSHDANKRPVDILASLTTSVHDSLANLVSNEILSAPDAYQSKVLIKVLISLQLTPNNYVHLRGLKVLSEQLLATVKERTAVKQLEKLDKQLADWLAKDPTLRPKSPSVNKRRSEATLEADNLEETLVNSNNMTSSQSPGRKRRVLFSQSQGTLLDPEMVEEEVRSGGEEREVNNTLINRTTVPSPVVPPHQQQDKARRVSSNSTSFSGVMSSTRLSSGDSRGEEAEATVVGQEAEKVTGEEEVEEVEVTTNPAPASKKAPALDIVGPSDSEEEEAKPKEVFEVLSASSGDDDIFSDASGVSQLSKVSLLPGDDDSTEESADDATPNQKPVARRGRGTKKDVFEASTDEEEATPQPATRRGGRSKKTGDKADVTPRPGAVAKKGRGGKKAADEEEEIVLTPPPKSPSPKSTVRKGRGRKAEEEQETQKPKSRGRPKKAAAVSSEEEESQEEEQEETEESEEEEAPKVTKGRGRAKATSVTEVIKHTPRGRGRGARSSNSSSSSLAAPASPGISRSGRSNSPRIDYKTGKPMTATAQEQPGPGRKRSSTKNTGSTGSVNNSPTPKKAAGTRQAKK